MSQIFDALHQSASERAGNGSRDFSAAKELLQVVERKTASPAAVLEPITRELRPESDCRQFTSAKVDSAGAQQVCLFSRSESLAAEKFRFLATRLRHLQQKRSIKRLVFTSSVSGRREEHGGREPCGRHRQRQAAGPAGGGRPSPSVARPVNLDCASFLD